MSLMEKIRQLELIEKDIAAAISSAGQGLQELSKDKPGNKHVETHTTNFLKTLEGVETGLTKQINYLTQVSTGQPHEGSNYAAQKDLQMAIHRVEHVKSRLNELEKLNAEHTRPRPPSVGQRSFSMPQTDHMT
ncbi:mediator of RNA polymerase II transcription subunit 11-like [Liolophura sinensis]|uniref:mediator of RNA polymerase II transcription subunit 11-like n=1 Tax=Liolophura sinensis TaxID=3198878 RepID=UPI0031582448